VGEGLIRLAGLIPEGPAQLCLKLCAQGRDLEVLLSWPHPVKQMAGDLEVKLGSPHLSCPQKTLAVLRLLPPLGRVDPVGQEARTS
jgi:hypothetical protein